MDRRENYKISIRSRWIFFFLNKISEYFIDQRSRALSSYITKYKALQNYSHMLYMRLHSYRYKQNYYNKVLSMTFIFR
jgi:hypothetical protein